MRKFGQTATEYLVILAIVIVLAVLVISILGGIPGFGGGVSENTARAALASAPVGIIDYAVSDYDTVFTVRNNGPNTITVDDISFGGEVCRFFYGTEFLILPGKQKQITCQNVFEIDDDSVSLAVAINYTDKKTGATYPQVGDELQLVGPVANKYWSTITSNDYWNVTSNDGCYDASVDPIPICTCVDLNKTRNNLTANYRMQNSIDFIRCNNEFDVDFRSGDGWYPIGSYKGIFDGGNHVILNSYSFSDSGTNVGLFRTGGDAIIKNLGVVNFNHTCSSGACNAAGITEYLSTGDVVENVFASGYASGTFTTGGIAGWAAQAVIYNSYFIGTLVGGTGTVGGIAGFSPDGPGNTVIRNVYSDAEIYGSGDIGGISGYIDLASIENAYWVNNSDAANSCAPEGNTGCTAVSSINQIPIR